MYKRDSIKEKYNKHIKQNQQTLCWGLLILISLKNVCAKSKVPGLIVIKNDKFFCDLTLMQNDLNPLYLEECTNAGLKPAYAPLESSLWQSLLI